MHLKFDPTAFVGTAGFFATLTLAEINTLVSVFVGVATLGFVVTKWVLLVRSRGGFRGIFFAQPQPIPVRSDEPPPPPAAT